MDDNHMFILRSNIGRFRRLLEDPLPDQMRKTIEGLLATVELELVRILNPCQPCPPFDRVIGTAAMAVFGGHPLLRGEPKRVLAATGPEPCRLGT